MNFARTIALVTTALCASSLFAATPDFPTKPLRFLVGFAPSGGADIVTRAISGKLGDALGQQVIVDNRPGGGGSISVAILAKAQPDGHTLLMANVGSLTVNPSLYANLGYDAVRDVAPVLKTADATNILCLNPSVAAGSVRELIALAKSKSLNGGSSGVGTAGHLSVELFNVMTGTKIVHVAYKGGGPVMIDLIAGNIQLVFSNPASAMAHIKAGKVKPIAVTTGKRLPLMPELPTVAESGVPGFEANNWLGVIVPASTPRNRISRLNKEIGAIFDSHDVREFLLKLGFEANPGTPEEFGAYIKSETAKWSKVIKAAGIKGE